MHRRSLALAIALALSIPWQAQAQTEHYPSRNIEIVVSYAAGGSTDLIARAVAEKLQKSSANPSSC
jgi:tripartite-type tricarboxylate transporter receptor subunit TctC